MGKNTHESNDDSEHLIHAVHPENKPSIELSKPTQKSQSKKYIILTVIAVAIIVVAALIAWYVLASKSTTEKTDEKTGIAATTHFDSSKDIISKASQNLAGNSVNVASLDGLGGRTADGFAVYNTATYKQPNGYAYASLPMTSSGAGFKGDSITETSDFSTLDDFFKQNKFVLLRTENNFVSTVTLDGQIATTVKQSVYESADALCLIQHIDMTNTPIAGHLTGIGCADKSSYLSAAKALNPLYTAYTKGGSNASPYIVLGFINSGKGVGGYEFATLYQENPETSQGSFKGLYYKKSSDSAWTYFKSYEQTIACSDFESDILKQAFAGLDCYIEPSHKLSVVS